MLKTEKKPRFFTTHFYSPGLSSFLNMVGLAAGRMSGGSKFHAAGPVCEKSRSPNLFCEHFTARLSWGFLHGDLRVSIWGIVSAGGNLAPDMNVGYDISRKQILNQGLCVQFITARVRCIAASDLKFRHESWRR